MRRVTADTNVLVSALFYTWQAVSASTYGLEGEINLAISQPIIDETLDILEAEFGIRPNELPEYRQPFIGDKDLLRIRVYNGICIMSVAGFLNLQRAR